MKATGSQSVVVCTATRSFGLSFMETSNCVLLVRPEGAPASEAALASQWDREQEVVARAAGTYVLAAIPSRTGILRSLMDRCPLDDVSSDADPAASLAWDRDDAAQDEDEEGEVGVEFGDAGRLSGGASGGGGRAGASGDGEGEDEVVFGSGGTPHMKRRRIAPQSSTPIPRDGSGRPIPVRSARSADEEATALARQVLFSWSDLRRVIQASDAELRSALEELHALQVGRFWRLVLPQRESEILDVFVDECARRRWSLLEIPADDLVALVAAKVPRALARHTLRKYGTSVASGAVGRSPIVALSIRRIAVSRGVDILRAAEAAAATARPASGASSGGGPGAVGMSRADFLRVWDASLAPLRALPPPHSLPVPPSSDGAAAAAPPPAASEFDVTAFRVSLDVLAGQAVLVTRNGAEEVKFLPAERLPLEPSARFAALFELRPFWTLADLEPYIRPLTGPGKTQADLMLAHTRTTVAPDGARLYSKR